ncbi:uncharacterized protein O3C94_005830 [Discoglossus pictus]
MPCKDLQPENTSQQGQLASLGTIPIGLNSNLLLHSRDPSSKRLQSCLGLNPKDLHSGSVQETKDSLQKQLVTQQAQSFPLYLQPEDPSLKISPTDMCPGSLHLGEPIYDKLYHTVGAPPTHLSSEINRYGDPDNLHQTETIVNTTSSLQDDVDMNNDSNSNKSSKDRTESEEKRNLEIEDD